MSKDTIYRQDAIDAVLKRDANCGIDNAEVLKNLPSAQPDPLSDIDRMKYYVCCPMCDLPKCVKGTVQCEAEQWAQARRKEGERDEID